MNMKHSRDDDRQFGPKMNMSMGRPQSPRDYDAERADIDEKLFSAKVSTDRMRQDVKNDPNLTEEQKLARTEIIDNGFSEYEGLMNRFYDQINMDERANWEGAQNDLTRSDDWGSFSPEYYSPQEPGPDMASDMSNTAYNPEGYQGSDMSNTAYDPGGYQGSEMSNSAYDPGADWGSGMADWGSGMGSSGEYQSEDSGQDNSSGMGM